MLNAILKWSATAILIVGTLVNSMGIYDPAGPIILLFGGVVWLVVAIRWKEPSLIVTNSVMIIASLIGFAFRM